MHTDSLSDEAPRSPALLALFVFAGVTTLVAWLGSVATTESVNSQWFESLEKPAFYPPDAVFGIVWTILYVLIALSGWLAWRHGGGADVIVPWSLQIALNLGWTVAFFAAREPLVGMMVIVALIGAATWTAVAMWDHSRVASLLFVPYILWVVFAGALNWSIVALN